MNQYFDFFNRIKQSAFIDELQKIAMVEVYDPKRGRPKKPIKEEPVDIPVVHNREDAGEQGYSVPSYIV